MEDSMEEQSYILKEHLDRDESSQAGEVLCHMGKWLDLPSDDLKTCEVLGIVRQAYDKQEEGLPSFALQCAAGIARKAADADSPIVQGEVNRLFLRAAFRRFSAGVSMQTLEQVTEADASAELIAEAFHISAKNTGGVKYLIRSTFGRYATEGERGGGGESVGG